MARARRASARRDPRKLAVRAAHSAGRCRLRTDADRASDPTTARTPRRDHTHIRRAGAGDTVAAVRDTRHWFIVVALAACGSESDIPDQCNPLGGQGCLLPWPSSVYETTDSTSATGLRLKLPENAMPRNLDGLAVDPASLNRWDGFSPTGPMLAQFPTGVSNANLPGW